MGTGSQNFRNSFQVYTTLWYKENQSLNISNRMSLQHLGPIEFTELKQGRKPKVALWLHYTLNSTTFCFFLLFMNGADGRTRELSSEYED